MVFKKIQMDSAMTSPKIRFLPKFLKNFLLCAVLLPGQDRPPNPFNQILCLSSPQFSFLFFILLNPHLLFTSILLLIPIKPSQQARTNSIPLNSIGQLIFKK